mmetsp:Transcript_13642/g.32435  ORF Transcript_13642/g.32435 Transcript_13642/m.32435 type:complete len:212 (+) Transcript_13642:866-1501(+)
MPQLPVPPLPPGKDEPCVGHSSTVPGAHGQRAEDHSAEQRQPGLGQPVLLDRQLSQRRLCLAVAQACHAPDKQLPRLCDCESVGNEGDARVLGEQLAVWRLLQVVFRGLRAPDRVLERQDLPAVVHLPGLHGSLHARWEGGGGCASRRRGGGGGGDRGRTPLGRARVRLVSRRTPPALLVGLIQRSVGRRRCEHPGVEGVDDSKASVDASG